MRYFQRAFSLRILMSAVFLGLIACVLASFLWDPLTVPVFVLVTGGVWLLAVLNDENVLTCPHCGKRVKLGSTVCHHCGRDATAKGTAAVSAPDRSDDPPRPTPRYPA